MVSLDELISIHAAREGGDAVECKFYIIHCISIHAAREGGDYHRYKLQTAHKPISIHAAREGGDVIAVYIHIPHIIFQSTPPVKAATII